MTNNISLAGDVSSALSHFALAGLAQVARKISRRPVYISWTKRAVSTPQLIVDDVTLEDIAAELINVASTWSGGWTSVTHTYGAGEFSPFSPRFKPIDVAKHPEDWQSHQAARKEAMDKLGVENDYLALRLIHGLGEAAYWRFDKKNPRPDHGASRWEMKTRNKGQEFIKDRFQLLAKEVAGWEMQRVVDGLTGRALQDVIGKNSETSRSSSGFTPPGPTDNALALAAILGISVFPVFHRMHKISITPCAFPDTKLHPDFMVLPVPLTPITVERYENIIVSGSLAKIVAENGAARGRPRADSNADSDNGDAHEQLKVLGVPACAIFKVNLGGSSSAPERYIEEGRVQLL